MKIGEGRAEDCATQGQAVPSGEASLRSASTFLTTSLNPSTARWLVKIMPPYSSVKRPLRRSSSSRDRLVAFGLCSRTGTNCGLNVGGAGVVVGKF